jgi:hypothetical protein
MFWGLEGLISIGICTTFLPEAGGALVALVLGILRNQSVIAMKHTLSLQPARKMQSLEHAGKNAPSPGSPSGHVFSRSNAAVRK